MWEGIVNSSGRFSRRLVKVTLIADDDALTINHPEWPAPVVIRWNEVDAIQTYKLDCVTWDDVVLAIKVADGWYELSEEDNGFMDVAEVMRRRFPSIPSNWYIEVMLPAFATNQRVLWSR